MTIAAKAPTTGIGSVNAAAPVLTADECSRSSAAVCECPLPDGFVSRRPQTKPRRVAGVLYADQARRLLLCTLGRVPNLRRSFDARFLHRALQLRRCGKRFSLLEAVEVMSYRDIIWIVDRLVNGLGNDAH